MPASHNCPTDALVTRLEIDKDTAGFTVEIHCGLCPRFYELRPLMSAYGRLEEALGDKLPIPHAEVIQLFKRTSVLRRFESPVAR